MSYDYSENILVQESSGKLLRDELGWEVKFAYNTEVLGKDGSFGRISYHEILLDRYFQSALKKLNPEYRQVLWMLYFDGMTNFDAAVVMKKNTRQMKNLVYRAKSALKSELEKEGFVYEEL